MKDNEIKELLARDKSEPKESKQTWSQIYSEISSGPDQTRGWLEKLRVAIVPLVAVASVIMVISLRMNSDKSFDIAGYSDEEQELLVDYLFENVGFAEDGEFTLVDETLSS